MRLAIGALLLAALLTACGGGGGSSTPRALPVSGSGSAPAATNSGATLTVTIHRGVVRGTRATRRGASAQRSPRFISPGANGLQVAVSTTGSSPTTKTIYADLSTNSTLCTTTGSVETCTVAVPTLAANEQIVATEVDQSPTGTANGYGTGFPTGSNILAVGSETVTLTLGQPISLTLGLSPVAGGAFVDETGDVPLAGIPAFSPTFGVDSDGIHPGRIVLSIGLAGSGIIGPQPNDAASNHIQDATPLPFVDLNGSPVPFTVTGSSSALTFALVAPGASPTPPPASAFTTTLSIPNDGALWVDDCFEIPVVVNVPATIPTGATVTVSNNLSALNPFLSPPAAYPQMLVYTIAMVSAGAVVGSPAVTGDVSASITGSDFGARHGMDAESSYFNPDESCLNSSGTTLAYVIPNGNINKTTWTQAFTITPVAAGSCTFLLFDVATGVPSQTVNLVVGP